MKKIDKDLLEAAQQGNLELCKKLIAQGADAKAKNGNGLTALHYASDNLELCKYLIEQGADVKVQTHYGVTALHYAAREGNLEVCKYLIEQGADLKAAKEDGEPILHWACKSGNLELCKYLIGQGEDVKAKDRHGSTVLHKANSSGNQELCKYLIEQGAKQGPKTKNCPWCGKEHPSDADFCMRCGRFLKDFTVDGLKKVGASQNDLTIQELREAVDSPECCHRPLTMCGLNYHGDTFQVELNNVVEYHKAEDAYYILPLDDYEDMLRQMAEDEYGTTTYEFQYADAWEDGHEKEEDVRFIPYMILEEFVCLVLYPEEESRELPLSCFDLPEY